LYRWSHVVYLIWFICSDFSSSFLFSVTVFTLVCFFTKWRTNFDCLDVISVLSFSLSLSLSLSLLVIEALLNLCNSYTFLSSFDCTASFVIERFWCLLIYFSKMRLTNLNSKNKNINIDSQDFLVWLPKRFSRLSNVYLHITLMHIVL